MPLEIERDKWIKVGSYGTEPWPGVGEKPTKEYRLMAPTAGIQKTAFRFVTDRDYKGSPGEIVDQSGKKLADFARSTQIEIAANNPVALRSCGYGVGDEYIESWVYTKPSQFKSQWVEVLRIRGHGAFLVPHLNVFGSKLGIATYTNGDQVLLPFLSFRLKDSTGRLLAGSFQAPEGFSSETYVADARPEMSLEVGCQNDQPFELRIYSATPDAVR